MGDQINYTLWALLYQTNKLRWISSIFLSKWSILIFYSISNDKYWLDYFSWYTHRSTITDSVCSRLRPCLYDLGSFLFVMDSSILRLHLVHIPNRAKILKISDFNTRSVLILYLENVGYKIIFCRRNKSCSFLLNTWCFLWQHLSSAEILSIILFSIILHSYHAFWL